jgi:hypothetical protein
VSHGSLTRLFVRGAAVVAIALTVSLAPGPRLAEASVSIAIPFDDLVRESSAALVVTPMSERVVWEDGRIITYTDVHVDEVVAGGIGGAADVWLRTRGGVVGHVGQSVEGEAIFTIGRPSLVFVRPPTQDSAGGSVLVVTARAQGQFPVVVEKGGALSVDVSGGLGARVPAAGVVLALHPLASDTLRGVRVEEARRIVQEAWRACHAP